MYKHRKCHRHTSRLGCCLRSAFVSARRRCCSSSSRCLPGR